MQQTIITYLKPNGKLDIAPDLAKKLINRKLKLIYEIESEEQEKDAKDFIDLLRNGPKIRLKNDHITREWIHERDDDGYLYR